MRLACIDLFKRVSKVTFILIHLNIFTVVLNGVDSSAQFEDMRLFDICLWGSLILFRARGLVTAVEHGTNVEILRSHKAQVAARVLKTAKSPAKNPPPTPAPVKKPTKTSPSTQTNKPSSTPSRFPSRFPSKMPSITPPLNDDACNAYKLGKVSEYPNGGTVTFDNRYATAEPNEVNPGLAGQNCEANDGWCPNVVVVNSVWFHLTADNAADVYFKASNDKGEDYQIAIWELIAPYQCENFSNFNEISANDDEGGGSKAAVTCSELKSGVEYYIQVNSEVATTQIGLLELFVVLSCI
jgi:hypothetical protein